jgi:hypothetical protein
MLTANITEAPLRSMTVGNLDVPHSTFGPTDRAMLQSPKAQVVAKKRIKTAIPIDINIYVIPGGAPWQRNIDRLDAMPMQDYDDDTYSQVLFNRQLEQWSGIMDAEDASEIIGQPIQVNDDSINVLYLSNANKRNSVPLTPWMMMHRLGHALDDAARKGHLGEATNNVIDEMHEFYMQMGSYMYGANLKNVMSMKSARDKTLDDADVIAELVAQYLYSGHIKLAEPVSVEASDNPNAPYQFTLSNGQTLKATNDEVDLLDDPMAGMAQKLHGDEESLEEYISIIVQNAIGRLVVAP